MKENVFDVLMYLFENYMDEGEGAESSPDQEALVTELAQAGFPHREIDKAFTWLEGLSSMRDQGDEVFVTGNKPGSLRHFSPYELDKINLDCRNFLYLLERKGVLEPHTREIVIDRIMALDVAETTIDQIKWIVLMVLYNQPGEEHSYAFLEDMVFDGDHEFLH